jgi:hypothetical protein
MWILHCSNFLNKKFVSFEHGMQPSCFASSFGFIHTTKRFHQKEAISFRYLDCYNFTTPNSQQIAPHATWHRFKSRITTKGQNVTGAWLHLTIKSNITFKSRTFEVKRHGNSKFKQDVNLNVYQDNVWYEKKRLWNRSPLEIVSDFVMVSTWSALALVRQSKQILILLSQAEK